MLLCSDGHEEVCYECNQCPVCEVMKEAAKKDDEISELNAAVDDQKDTISKLNDELDSAAN